MWANGGLLNVVADGCVLAWNVTQTERKLPKISLRDSGRAQTDRHSVSCIVMQRAENVPDAFFRFSPGKHLFLRFLRQNRAERVSAVRVMRRYGKSVWHGKLQNFYALKALRGQPGRLARH